MTVERAPLGRPFWTLFSSATVSGLGDGLRYTALPLLAASLTRDPLQVALVSVASYLPVALFGLLSGAVAGRVTSSYRLVGMGVMPVGAALGGLASRAYWLRAPYLIGGAVMLVATVLALPTLVRADRAGEAEQVDA